VGATVVTADQYKDGELQINDGTGHGHTYNIDTNSACGSAGDTVVTLKDSIRVALVASGTTQVSLVKNPWADITQSATTTSGSAGVTKMAISDGYYFWLQTGGSVCMLSSGSDGLGTVLSNDGTEGACEVMADFVASCYGFTWYTVHASGEYKPAFLFID